MRPLSAALSAPTRPTIRAGLAALLVCGIAGTVAQTARAEPSPRAEAPPPIGCTSLANLRAVLRQSGGNPVAMLAAITNVRADLGCAVVDPASVSAIADHVNLNGSAYDCLTLKGTGICHWVVAGTVRPAAATTVPDQTPTPPRKTKH